MTYHDMASGSQLRELAPSSPSGGIETDPTVQAFARWLAELKSKSGRNLHEMLSEMSIIRDSITSNNVELTDYKRHSTGVSQQMQSQLTDLREKLTNAFGEITTLVKQKTQVDQELMQDINALGENLSSKNADLEMLKRSYSQAHAQLHSTVVGIQNHLQVTNGEVLTSKAAIERVERETKHRFANIDASMRSLEDDLTVGNAENRKQMLQLHEEVSRIHESLASVQTEFQEHKRASNAVHNKIQTQVTALEERKARGGLEPMPAYSEMTPHMSSYQPASGGMPQPVAMHAQPIKMEPVAKAPGTMQNAHWGSSSNVQSPGLPGAMRPGGSGNYPQPAAVAAPPTVSTVGMQPGYPSRSGVVMAGPGQQPMMY